MSFIEEAGGILRGLLLLTENVSRLENTVKDLTLEIKGMSKDIVDIKGRLKSIEDMNIRSEIKETNENLNNLKEKVVRAEGKFDGIKELLRLTSDIANIKRKPVPQETTIDYGETIDISQNKY